MNTKILLIVFFLCTISLIAAQDNHMDIMTTITGEHNFSHMGWVMTTLDWNGDSYDDLIVDSNNWKPEEYQSDPYIMPYGKLYIYLGGTNFDNIPEITLPGSYENEFWATFSMCNAGDMNHDGYDDLALFRATMYEGGSDQNYDLQLCVFYGDATPDTIPDYVLTFPREEWDNTYCYVRGLGDVNHDGYDDIGYTLRENGLNSSYSFNIIYGQHNGIFSNSQLMIAGSISGVPNLVGVGDVNGDGFDDFCLGYMHEINNVRYRKVTLYFGDSNSAFNDSLLICDGSDIRNTFSYSAGDLNWDGIADFVSVFTSSTARLYFGGTNFDGTDYVNLEPSYNGETFGEGFSYGDVNGNGTDDLMGTFVTQANGYGDAYLWMGGVPMNGTPDLHLTPAMGSQMEMFGYCLTMGDYNGDGYCDAAISAPFDYAAFAVPGRVFVYAGNRQLNDPTPIADDTQTPIIPQLKLYPNPLQPTQSNLNVRFIQLTPLPPSSRGVSSFEIYNIRGQKVKSFTLSAEQTKSGSANYNLNEISSGVYVCVFTNGDLEIKGKITVIR